MSDIQTFLGVQDVGTLAQAIVDTVAEPLVVLNGDLRVVTASRSFYLTFKVDRQSTQGKLLYDLGEGQWDIAELRILLEKVLPEHGVVEG
jgi:chemotaxis protein methyltransferase CheR